MSETDELGAYVVTFLEMTARPSRPIPPQPWIKGGAPHALMRVTEPATHFFLYLYQTVGAPHQWTDLLSASEETVAAFVKDPAVELYTLYRAGAPVGFFQLDFRTAPICDIAYFGLMPEATGQRLGPWLLATAINEAWSPTRKPPIEKLTVNTCTLDHPAALRTYQKAGFQAVRRETRRR